MSHQDDVEIRWEQDMRRKEHQRRADRLFAWAEYHRSMAQAARANGEAVGLYHDKEVERLEGLITQMMTRPENAA